MKNLLNLDARDVVILSKKQMKEVSGGAAVNCMNGGYCPPGFYCAGEVCVQGGGGGHAIVRCDQDKEGDEHPASDCKRSTVEAICGVITSKTICVEY